jgi:hypothetical protein
MVGYSTNREVIDVIRVNGADSINGIALAGSAVVDNGDGTVKLTTAAAHGLLAGSVVYIEGSTNYDGLSKLESIPSTTTFTIKAPFVAETPAGTETVKIAVTSKKPFKFLGFRLQIAVAPGQADVMSITLDSSVHANYDTVIYSNDMDAVTDLEYINPNVSLPFEADDILRFAWPNVANRTFGIEIFTQPLN